MKPGKRGTLHLQALGRFMLLLAIPVAIGALMWLFARQAQRRSEWVAHSLRVQISLERLVADLKNGSSSHRGYLLTSADSFLQAYRSAATASRHEIYDLFALTADDPNQQHFLNELRPIVEYWHRDLESEQELARSGKLDKTTIPAGIEEDRAHLATVLALVDAMYREEDQLLQGRSAALDFAAKRFYWLLILGYAFIMAVVASLYLSVKRYEQQAQAAEAHLSQLNGELDQRVRERTALLKAREDLLNVFIQRAPVPVAMLDRDMRYLQMSDRWCTDYGIERSRLSGAAHYELFPDIPERWREIHRRCLAGETSHANEDRWDRGDGQSIWLRWEVRPWGNRGGLPEGLLIFSEDITERKNNEEALRESEATTRTLLETASQAILAVNASGVIVLANHMAGSMFGYAPQELVGHQHGILLPPGLRARHAAHSAAFFADPKARMMGPGMDLVGCRKDGTSFPIEVSLSTVQTKEGLLAVSFVSDITTRKQAETALRNSEEALRALARKLLTAQEEERRNLSRELHDGVTQQLAFLSIELGRIAKELPLSAQASRERISVLQAQTLRAASDVRRLSHGLHPSVITDFGLSVALEEFCKEFEKAHEVKVEYHGPAEDLHLSELVATYLFRIAQEGLHNAVVHGQAQRAKVTLSTREGLIQLRIADNGSGFRADSGPTKTGLGLVSMMERIRLVNGELTVSSSPGQGTEVIASVPMTEGHHGTP